MQRFLVVLHQYKLEPKQYHEAVVGQVEAEDAEAGIKKLGLKVERNKGGVYSKVREHVLGFDHRPVTLELRPMPEEIGLIEPHLQQCKVGLFYV